MKACESCASRVEIAKNHRKIPILQRGIGMILIYLPILTIICAWSAAKTSKPIPISFPTAPATVMT
jgi:hypothetical protein